jgi:hypothetical protein
MVVQILSVEGPIMMRARQRMRFGMVWNHLLCMWAVVVMVDLRKPCRRDFRFGKTLALAGCVNIEWFWPL